VTVEQEFVFLVHQARVVCLQKAEVTELGWADMLPGVLEAVEEERMIRLRRKELETVLWTSDIRKIAVAVARLDDTVPADMDLAMVGGR
jgi:hypothetical protein